MQIILPLRGWPLAEKNSNTCAYFVLSNAATGDGFFDDRFGRVREPPLELASDIDVPPNRMSEIVNGKRAITADTALRLGEYFGGSPEIWLDLQSDYDLRVMRRTLWKRVEPRVWKRVA